MNQPTSEVIEAFDALRRKVGVFSWYTGEDDSVEYPVTPLLLLEIFLDDPEITDDELVHLKPFPNLECLSLDDSQITDLGLRHIAHLKNLRQLFLVNTKVTNAGIELLRRELPECDIER